MVAYNMLPPYTFCMTRKDSGKGSYKQTKFEILLMVHIQYKDN